MYLNLLRIIATAVGVALIGWGTICLLEGIGDSCSEEKNRGKSILVYGIIIIFCLMIGW